nr:MAG TPA: hypothetical protein [Caudoviricetes sp.]
MDCLTFFCRIAKVHQHLFFFAKRSYLLIEY